MCASVLRVDGEPARIFDDNVAMVRHLVESLHGLSPLSFIFLSSADVYGHPAAGQVLTEASPPHPQGYYGLSKVVCEQLLGLGLTCPLAVLRLPGVYGQGDHGRSVIGQFSRRILAGETLTLVDGGRPRRDYVVAGDVAKVVLAQIRRRASLTLNLATGRSLSLLELVERIAAASGRPARIEFQETASPQYDLVFDRSALTNAFADLDMTSMPTGIDDYVSLLRKGSAPAG
jgi:nucleoside-diphosphate-sugar epimerase